MALPFKKWVYKNEQATYREYQKAPAEFAGKKRFSALTVWDKHLREAVGQPTEGDFFQYRTWGLESGVYSAVTPHIGVLWGGEMVVDSDQTDWAHYNVCTDAITGRTFKVRVEPRAPSTSNPSPCYLSLWEYDFGIAHHGDFEDPDSTKIRKTTALWEDHLVGGDAQTVETAGTDTLFSLLQDEADDWEDEAGDEFYWAFTDSFIANDVLYVAYGGAVYFSIDIKTGALTNQHFKMSHTAQLNGLISGYLRSSWGYPKVMVDRKNIYLYFSGKNNLAVVPFTYDKFESALAAPYAIQNALANEKARKNGTLDYFALGHTNFPNGTDWPLAFLWDIDEEAGTYSQLSLLYSAPQMTNRTQWLASRNAAAYSMVHFSLAGADGTPQLITATQQINNSVGSSYFQDAPYWSANRWRSSTANYYYSYPPVRHGSRLGLAKYGPLNVAPGEFFVKLMSRELDVSLERSSIKNDQGVVQSVEFGPEVRQIRCYIQPKTITHLWDDPFQNLFTFNDGGYQYQVVNSREVRSNMWECVCNVTGTAI